MFNYENWLTNLMYKVANELNLNGYNFEVYNEQSFVKKKDITPKTIYVILKYLSSSKVNNLFRILLYSSGLTSRKFILSHISSGESTFKYSGKSE